MREKLIALSIVKKGNWNEIYKYLRTDSKLKNIDDVASCQLVNNLKCDAITLVDKDYPHEWREMSKPPFVVYLKGNRSLLKKPSLSIIGGKQISHYTKKEIEKLVKNLPPKISIATGFEQGAEVYANQFENKRLVCLASGFATDELYQKNKIYHKLSSDDLIMSELPPYAKFDLQAYYRSYHLIAELSQVICIFELANFDLRVKYLNYLTEIGKDVFVLPDKLSRQTDGGIAMINRGAKCLLQPSDIAVLYD